MHYNQVFKEPFRLNQIQMIYKPSCFVPPYNQQCWKIDYPDLSKFHSNTVVLMHCPDFVTPRGGKVAELLKMEKHFGDKSKNVVVITMNEDLHTVYDGPLNLVYFNTHGYEILNNLRETQDTWKTALHKPRSKNWQCLNGTFRHHRKLVAMYMQENFTNGVLSLSNRIPLEGELHFDHYHGCANEDNWMRLLPIYSDCKVNIVTETQYYESPGLISEKTEMAFLALQVPIMIGHVGIVEDCEQHGFDMFTDIVDTSYDSIEDSDIRWQVAIDSNKDIINGKFDYESLKDRLLANQDHVLNKWPQKMIDDFNNSVQDIVARLRP